MNYNPYLAVFARKGKYNANITKFCGKKHQTKPKHVNIYTQIKSEINKGHYRGTTLKELCFVTRKTRHQLRHHGISAKTLALGNMDLRIPNRTLADIWGVSCGLIQNRRISQFEDHKTDWSSHEELQAAIDAEKKRASKYQSKRLTTG